MCTPEVASWPQLPFAFCLDFSATVLLQADYLLAQLSDLAEELDDFQVCFPAAACVCASLCDATIVCRLAA